MKFTYQKEDGSRSDRNLYVLEKPSDCFFGIDLSEFSEQEQEQYQKMLGQLTDSVKTEIENMGLGTCYRQFKKDRIL